jgi:hypothetical protein
MRCPNLSETHPKRFLRANNIGIDTNFLKIGQFLLISLTFLKIVTVDVTFTELTEFTSDFRKLSKLHQKLADFQSFCV